jgi:hypothetical protein
MYALTRIQVLWLAALLAFLIESEVEFEILFTLNYCT